MENIIRIHKDKLKKDPVIIGMFWENPNILEKNLLDAIKNNTPYNEYEMLSDEEKKSFDAGRLLF